MAKLRRQTKVKKTGFKKITVKYPRKKLKKRGSCDQPKDFDFVPRHTEHRRAGRTIRKAAQQKAAA